MFYLQAQDSAAQAGLGEEYKMKAEEAMEQLDALSKDTEQLMRDHLEALDQPIG